MRVLRHAVTTGPPGTFNVAGDGLLTLSQAVRRLGTPSVSMPGFAVGRARQLDGVSVLRPTLANPNYNLINQLGFAVGAFSIDDVRPASELDFSKASLVEAHSFDGLAVQLHVIRQGDAYWALVSAQRAPTATEAIAQEAAAINARARGWAFKVPAEKGVALMATLAELATPPAPKQGSISLTGMPSAPPPRQ